MIHDNFKVVVKKGTKVDIKLPDGEVLASIEVPYDIELDSKDNSIVVERVGVEFKDIGK